MNNDASSLNVQIGGNHYKNFIIQPVEYVWKNDIPFIEGSVIKYVTRWKSKGGINDLRKARHFLDLLIEFNNEEKGPIDSYSLLTDELEEQHQLHKAALKKIEVLEEQLAEAHETISNFDSSLDELGAYYKEALLQLKQDVHEHILSIIDDAPEVE